jgi:cytidylate kinase
VKVIAIDGPAGSGKSTVARRLATDLGLQYLDTGAMYRSVAFAALRRGIDPDETEPVARVARDLDLRMEDDGTVWVDGIDASIEIRGPEVTRAVSAVAANPGVRDEMRSRQREWAARHGGGVLEGRDIGTVVFPDAELKIYLDAAASVRAARRSQEVTDLSYETVAADIARRDAYDQGRTDSPLRRAAGAVVIDTTDLTIDQIVDRVVGEWARHDPARTPAADGPERAGRPVIEKRRADQRIIIPEGHARGEEMSRGQQAVYRATWLLAAGIGYGYYRAKVSGAEHVPATGPFILAPVHRSNLDTPLVALATHRRLRYMGKESMWKKRWSAWYLTAAGGFPVERATADRSALNACLRVLERGEPLVLFPEGTRQSGPVVTEMFDGAAWLACRAQCPIVPVGLGGTEAALGKGTKLPRPVRLTVVVGKPLPPPPPTPGGRTSRRSVRELTEQLRTSLQELFDEAQRRAGQPAGPTD